VRRFKGRAGGVGWEEEKKHHKVDVESDVRVNQKAQDHAKSERIGVKKTQETKIQRGSEGTRRVARGKAACPTKYEPSVLGGSIGGPKPFTQKPIYTLD